MGFNEMYTQQQREAVARAFVDRRVRPAGAVAQLAARGELEGADGERLAPFTIPESTVRSFSAGLRRRRRGEVRSNLANAPARDAVEALRVRLINASDVGLASVERRQRRERGKTDWTELREVARAVREIAALPGPDEGRPVAPGLRERDSGQRRGGQTRGGLAGAMLAAHRSSGPNGAVDLPPAEPVEPESGVPESDADLVARYAAFRGTRESG